MDAPHVEVVTDVAIGVVGRSDAADAGGAATAEVAVLAGRIAAIGPFARGRYDFGRRVSGAVGLELSLRITEVLVVAPSIGVATDGTAGVVGACFVGVRSGVPADGRFRFDLASLGVAASMQQLGTRSDLAVFVVGNPVAIVLLPVVAGVWIATGRFPGH